MHIAQSEYYAPNPSAQFIEKISKPIYPLEKNNLSAVNVISPILYTMLYEP